VVKLRLVWHNFTMLMHRDVLDEPSVPRGYRRLRQRRRRWQRLGHHWTNAETSSQNAPRRQTRNDHRIRCLRGQPYSTFMLFSFVRDLKLSAGRHQTISLRQFEPVLSSRQLWQIWVDFNHLFTYLCTERATEAIQKFTIHTAFDLLLYYFRNFKCLTVQLFNLEVMQAV